jgi:hypothetical protein
MYPNALIGFVNEDFTKNIIGNRVFPLISIEKKVEEVAKKGKKKK